MRVYHEIRLLINMNELVAHIYWVLLSKCYEITHTYL